MSEVRVRAPRYYFDLILQSVEWIDSSRDILNFMMHYLPDQAGNLDLPTFLEPVQNEEALRRRRDGFRLREMVGVGHSLGGCTT